MILELSANNFKSWKNINQMKFSQITGLFGANSSGKTSILQLLLMLKQTVDSPDRAQPLIFDTDKGFANLGTFQDVIHAHKLSSHLTWSIRWKTPQKLCIEDSSQQNKTLFEGDTIAFKGVVKGDTSKQITLSISYDFADHSFSMVAQHPELDTEYKLKANGTEGPPFVAYFEDKTPYKLEANGTDDFKFAKEKGRTWPLPAPIKCYGFPEQVKYYYKNAGFLSDLQLSFEKLFNGLYYLGPLREYPKRQYTWGGEEPSDMGQRGERTVHALLASQQRGKNISLGKGKKRKSLEEYVAFWLKELGLIHSFQLEPISHDSNLYRVRVQKTPDSSKVLLTDVGFGVSQILPVLVLCYYVPENSIIILEQPEIHLHPSVQAGLADVFIDATQKRNVQIIFESHSEHLLRRLQRRTAEEKIKADDTSLYFCESKNGSSTLSSLQLDNYGNIKNWPKDFFGDEFGEIAAMTRSALKRQGTAK